MQALDPIEQEKLNEIKGLWREYGSIIIAVVLTFIISYSGFQYWNFYKKNQAEAAALVFETLEEKLLAKDVEGAELALKKLIAEYSDVPYTAIAAMQVAIARYNLEKPATSSAIEHLDWVVKNAKAAWIRDWGRIQWLQLLYASGEYKKVTELSNRHETLAAESIMLEIKGDAYVQMGKASSAMLAYQMAEKAEAKTQLLDDNPVSNQKANPVLRIKRQSLGLTQ